MLSLRSAWESLPAPTMFQTFAWNYAAAQVFGERERPFVIYVEDDNGAALIPAAIADARLTLLGESLFDYRDVLMRGDRSALKAAWARASEPGLDFSAGALRADANFDVWDGFERGSFYGAPLVSHNVLSAEAFVAEHNRLGRWRRRLEREGAELRSQTGANSALVRAIYEQKASQPAETGDSLFRDPLRVDFMVQACAAVGPLCEIFTLETAGAMVAALVTFRDGSVRRFYTVQFDPAWAKYSPGMVLIHEVTRRSLSDAMDCDYMTGEHAYKLRFATSVVPMFWVRASAAALGVMGTHRPVIAA
jgi:CelD/BcsL family acetyltransferase involved in cellulose biosynthesis